MYKIERKMKIEIQLKNTLCIVAAIFQIIN